ncbi:MAG TPA: hypothetical protein VE077_13660 [Candidatus Methylomirabilis sp.]|nr:hypothetical protein [Candidatus Methylomirabilis sp.]
MMDSNFWTQVNWYAVGTLLTQVAFLVAAVWFAKSILKIVRSFQEQIGALLKLSITSGLAERQAEGGSVKHALGETSPYWLTPPEGAEAAPAPQLVESGPSRVAVAWHTLGAASHRVGHWLQEPIGGQGAGPLRRVVQWLQSPGGTPPAVH